ncbi:MAG: alpha/beta fold hydrolase [Chloroflexi bacterium]|nr:alpha/beta fold hydrolase [Chloroflexota bacterium]
MRIYNGRCPPTTAGRRIESSESREDERERRLNSCKLFEPGDVELQSGETLRDARLAYVTFGELNEARDNAIVMPTYYGGSHVDNARLIGDGHALDPGRYFIVVPNMLGNGVSSSPSNTTSGQGGAGFPHVTLYDNVMLQHRLVTEELGIDRLALVCGFSMGAQQTYHWAALFPDMVERILPWCGSAKTSRHNYVFLEGAKAALTADDAWRNGAYDAPPLKGLRAFGRVYAGWGPSQAFYREQAYRDLGFATVEEFIVGQWEERFAQKDANDLLAMLWSWQNADISANARYDGDFESALRGIKAKALVMPSQTDQYFPVADSEYEVGVIANAELRPIPSIWGHMAGSPGLNPKDNSFLDSALMELLES